MQRKISQEKPEIFGIERGFLIAMGRLVFDTRPDYQVHKKNHKRRVENRARPCTNTLRGFYTFFKLEKFQPVDLSFLATSAIDARPKVIFFAKLLTIDRKSVV